jgi:hypothetical protein
VKEKVGEEIERKNGGKEERKKGRLPFWGRLTSRGSGLVCGIGFWV